MKEPMKFFSNLRKYIIRKLGAVDQAVLDGALSAQGNTFAAIEARLRANITAMSQKIDVLIAKPLTGAQAQQLRSAISVLELTVERDAEGSTAETRTMRTKARATVLDLIERLNGRA